MGSFRLLGIFFPFWVAAMFGGPLWEGFKNLRVGEVKNRRNGEIRERGEHKAIGVQRGAHIKEENEETHQRGGGKRDTKGATPQRAPKEEERTSRH